VQNNERAFSFACRLFNCWNSLPDCVGCATSVYSFKRLLESCDLILFLTQCMFSDWGHCKCHSLAWWSISSFLFVLSFVMFILFLLMNKQGVALTGRNRTGPPCIFGRRPALPPAALQMTTTDASEQNNTGTLGGPVINKQLLRYRDL